MNALRQWDGGSPQSLRGELLQAEDASWAEFRAITGQLNFEQMGRPGYQDEWSVKDLPEQLLEKGSTAREWFAESGITHDEEHLPRLGEWVDLFEIPE
jgi:hypothetical protein